jgi:hypothetical protein
VVATEDLPYCSADACILLSSHHRPFALDACQQGSGCQGNQIIHSSISSIPSPTTARVQDPKSQIPSKPIKLPVRPSLQPHPLGP